MTRAARWIWSCARRRATPFRSHLIHSARPPWPSVFWRDAYQSGCTPVVSIFKRRWRVRRTPRLILRYTPEERWRLPSSLSLRSSQFASTRFRQSQRKHCGYKAGPCLQEKGRPNSGPDRQSSNGERRQRGKAAAHVVTEPHRRSANLAGKNFAGNGGIAGKETGSEERHEGPEHQQPEFAAG